MADTTIEPLELNEVMVCGAHRLEQCSTCNTDYREENDAFFGLDPIDRPPLAIPALAASAKDGSWPCKKHSNTECAQCFNWKKQLNKLHKDAKKAR